MATHSSIFAWKIPRTEEPGRLQFMGSQKVGHDWGTEDTHARPEVSKLFMSDLPGYVYGHVCTHTCTHFYINEVMRYTLLHILLFKFIIYIFYILSYSKSCIALNNLDRPLLYILVSYRWTFRMFPVCFFFFSPLWTMLWWSFLQCLFLCTWTCVCMGLFSYKGNGQFEGYIHFIF